MYGMMNTTGFGFSFALFHGLHMIAFFVTVVGIALLLLWAFKHLTTKDLWKWGWSLLVIGSLVCLLTLPAGRMHGNYFNNGYGMMKQWNTEGKGKVSDEQRQEEAEGKALYDKLQAKEVTCADLSDDDFELIGEYVMGKQSGSSHEQMNARIKQMMGNEGEVQMHIILAKNATACTSGNTSSESFRGMMQ